MPKLRLRLYTKRVNFFQQNKSFSNNAKKLYRELGKKAITFHSLIEVKTFWSKIWVTRPITMLHTGSKTKPRKTSMSQLRNGQTSPQRRPSKPFTRPATGKPQDATAWQTSGSNN